MKPTVPQVKQLVRQLYDRNAVGCCLHITLDDCNIKDGHIRFCREEAARNGHLDCLQIADLLLAMSKTQRRKLIYGG